MGRGRVGRHPHSLSLSLYIKANHKRMVDQLYPFVHLSIRFGVSKKRKAAKP